MAESTETSPPYRFPSRYDGYLLITGMIWGTGWPIAKAIYRELPPLAFLTIREGVGLLAILVLVWLRRHQEPWRPLAPRERWKLMAWGALGTGISPMAAFVALNHTTISNAALLANTGPIFGLIFTALVWRVSASRMAWFGVLLSFAGIYLLLYNRVSALGFSGATLKGDLLCLVAPVTWALYTIGIYPYMAGRSPLRILAVTFSAGTGTIFILAQPYLWSTDWGAVTWPTVMGCSYMGVFASGICLLCWSLGIARLGSGRTILYDYVAPVVASILGIVWFGKSWSALKLAAVACVFTGMYLAQKRA